MRVTHPASLTPAQLDTVRRPMWAGTIAVRDKASSAVAYIYDRNGQPCAQLYSGKRAKPDEHYRYRSAARREEAIRAHFEGVRQREARKRSRTGTPHKLQVGHILHTSWGYDQTNVEFFEVTRIVGPFSVELREIGAASEAAGMDAGRCIPMPGEYRGEPIVRRAYGDRSGVRIDEVRSAWMWELKPLHHSWGR